VLFKKGVDTMSDQEIYITIEDYCNQTGQNPEIIRADIDARDRKGKLEDGVYWIAVDESWEGSEDLQTRQQEQQDRLSNMIVTTSMFVAGREIEREINVVTSECVYGMNIFRDIFAGFRDVVGGRSKASEKVLRDARKEAMEGLKNEAAKLRADAVIAIDIDYMEVSVGKSGMLVAIASGTAVKLK